MTAWKEHWEVITAMLMQLVTSTREQGMGLVSMSYQVSVVGGQTRTEPLKILPQKLVFTYMHHYNYTPRKMTSLPGLNWVFPLDNKMWYPDWNYSYIKLNYQRRENGSYTQIEANKNGKETNDPNVKNITNELKSNKIIHQRFRGKRLSLFLWSLVICYFLFLMVCTPVTNIILQCSSSLLNLLIDAKHRQYCSGHKLCTLSRTSLNGRTFLIKYTQDTYSVLVDYAKDSASQSYCNSCDRVVGRFIFNTSVTFYFVLIILNGTRTYKFLSLEVSWKTFETLLASIFLF